MSPKAPLPPEFVEEIRANIHPFAHPAIVDWDTFSWHRAQDTGLPDSHVLHSSQAFCISVWGTLVQPAATEARRILYDLLADPRLSEAGDAAPTGSLEFTNRSILNEYVGIPTNVDAFLVFPGLVVAVESKLTEVFGKCSQAKNNHCTGIYGNGSDLKTATDARCRLEMQDGRRTPRHYWDVMRPLSIEGAYVDGEKCPFVGHGYQVMRNIAFAAESGSRKESDWRVIFAFPAELSKESKGDVAKIAKLLKPEYRRRVLVLDYRDLADGLLASEDRVASDLGAYMKSRLDPPGRGH